MLRLRKNEDCLPIVGITNFWSPAENLYSQSSLFLKGYRAAYFDSTIFYCDFANLFQL